MAGLVSQDGHPYDMRYDAIGVHAHNIGTILGSIIQTIASSTESKFDSFLF